MKRRAFVTLAAASLLAGCFGVTPYSDVGPGNLTVRFKAADSNLWTQRGAVLDIWTGPSGPNMEYLGTRDIPASGTVLGLPTGRPLHLVLVFEEGSFLGNHSQGTSIQLPMEALSSSERWLLTISNTRAGFSYDLTRQR